MKLTYTAKKRSRLLSLAFLAVFLATALLPSIPVSAADPSPAAKNCLDMSRYFGSKSFTEILAMDPAALDSARVQFKSCRTAEPQAPIGLMTLPEQVLSYTYMSAMAVCAAQNTAIPGSRGSTPATSRTVNDLGGRAYFTKGKVYLGPAAMYDPSGGNTDGSGQRSCKDDGGLGHDWVVKAMELWNKYYQKVHTGDDTFTNPIRFACDVLQLKNTDGNDCISANNFRYQGTDADNRYRVMNKLRDLIYGASSGGVGGQEWSIHNSGAQLYMLHMLTLTNGCGATPLGDRFPDSSMALPAVLDWVDENNEITPTKFVWTEKIDEGDFLNLTSNTPYKDNSYIRANRADGREVSGCGGVINAMNDHRGWAEDYRRYVLLDSTGAAAPGSPGDISNPQPDEEDIPCNNGSFEWLICPLIKLGVTGVNRLDGFIMQTLNVDVAPIFDDTDIPGTPSYGYYRAWNSFRIIAVAILIIGGLIMLISQALGFEMLDAYTIRKTLPRLLIAAIGISLSWPLMRLVVDFFDSVGFGIRQLMYAPFSELNGGLGAGAGILTTALFVGILFAMGPAALTFLLSALIAIIVGYLGLVVRQIAIVMLIIVAPIAIACYILPNTQKVWKMWSSNFLGMLLAFPIISALIATGHIFAAVALSGTDPSLVQQGLAIIAYFAPYGMIPTALGWSNKLLGTAAGIFKNATKGMSAGLSKVRGNAAAKRWQDLRAGKRFEGGTEGNLRGKLNRALGVASNIDKAGVSGVFRPDRGYRRIQSHLGAHGFDSAMEGLEKNSHMRAIKDNGALLRAALAGKGTTADARAWLSQDQYDSTGKKIHSAMRGAELERSVQGIDQARRSMGDHSFRIAAAVAQGGTKDYEDSGEMLQTVAKASGGDEALASRMAFATRGLAQRSGRNDLGDFSAGAMLEELHSAMTGGSVDVRRLSLDAFENMDSVSIGRGTTKSVQQLTGAATARIKELAARTQPGSTQPLSVKEQEELGRLQGALENLGDVAPTYYAPERAAAVGVASREARDIPGAGMTIAVDQQQAMRDSQQYERQVQQTVTYGPYDIETRQPVLPERPTVAPTTQSYTDVRSSRGGRPTLGPDEAAVRDEYARRKQQDREREGR